MKKQKRADAVVAILAEMYAGAECELDYRTPWELLVATILSAQCTDQRVNQVTPGLFARWPGPAELARASQDDVEELVRPTGFYRNKARSLLGAAEEVTVEYGGELPRDVGAMVRLPGVGRKTANVVLGEAFGIPAGIAVDTHVRRVSRRLGLAEAEDPERIEEELEALIPEEEWVRFSMRMILHGRRVCGARKPRCGECPLEGVCLKAGV